MMNATEEARERYREKRRRPGWPLRINDRREVTFAVEPTHPKTLAHQVKDETI